MFYVQLYGKWGRRGRYDLYFEALKGLLLKKAFFGFLQKMSHYIPEHN